MPSQRHVPWPKRADVALLSFFAMMIALADRINLSVTAPVLMKAVSYTHLTLPTIYSV